MCHHGRPGRRTRMGRCLCRLPCDLGWLQRNPEAAVVRPEPSAPTKTYFDGETVVDLGLSVDMSKDVTAFFLWAYDNCPAAHYAVFFWGHAMGPAGLFEPNEKPLVISPLLGLLVKALLWLTKMNSWSGSVSVKAVSDAIGAVVERRILDSRKGRDGDGSTSTPGVQERRPVR